MKLIIRKFAVVVLFLITALIIFNIAPQYELKYKYKEGDIRVVFNDKEITRNLSKLPQTALLVDGEIMLSQDTIDILFDKNLYYEEKYETLITTTTEHRADIKINSKVIKIDDKKEILKVPPITIKYNYEDDDRYDELEDSKKKIAEDVIYIPIKALEDVYDITVEFKEKIIITENSKNRARVIVTEGDTIELKHTNDKLSKNVEVLKAGDYIDIYDYSETADFLLARSSTGEIGYVNNEKLKLYNILAVTPEKEEIIIPKYNIAWDYFGPNATGIGEKEERPKYGGLDVVAPTLLYLKNTEGEIRYNSNVVNSYMKWAKGAGYKVWVTLKNEYADRHFSLDETSTFLNDMVYREQAISEMIRIAKIYKIDGINIDIEWIYEKDATAFSQFIRELCVKAKQNGIIVSVCVNVPDGSPNWSLCYQHKDLSEYADYLALMAYDQYGASSTIAGPNASLSWVSTNLDKLVNRDQVKSEKILLGIPFYSRLWKINNGATKSTTVFMNGAQKYINEEPNAVWSEDDGQYYYENKTGTVKIWIEDNNSITKKLELANEFNLGGTAYWMLGYENEEIWKTIKDKTKGN